MNANAISLLAIFEKKMRLEVPLFQRQYVWSRTQQWEPLWEDIARKFTEFLNGRKDAPVHFLGAMVLDQKQTPTTHVEKRQIIDGQQRLTTLQIFIAAFRDFCALHNCAELAKECETFAINKGMMADPEVDKFKVWPTKLDRKQFSDVMVAASRAALEELYPLKRRRYARKPDPRPKMVEAYLFFSDRIGEFFVGDNTDLPPIADGPLPARLEECFQALRNALQVVVIDLETGDDAQVIFETLNARGEPLLPADLLRNYIFLRAARQGESQETLYMKYWQRFDEPFWREEVKQGRLKRPRSDLFLQHFLASRQGVDIPIKHLFVEYKFWIEKETPFATVEDELATLSRQGNDFRRIISPKRNDPLFSIASLLEAFDVRTAYPLLLKLLDANIEDTQWAVISRTLESYLVRRAICGLTTKNYNRVFLGLTRNVQSDATAPDKLRRLFVDQSGESVEWPTNEKVSDAWQHGHAYHTMNNSKIVYVLRRLNDTYYSSKMEVVPVEGRLTVEHILPQKWLENWPLPDGSTGLNTSELEEAAGDDRRVAATRRRNAAVQTMGNLTILTQPLNSAVSNDAWKTKQTELMRHSLLPINQPLQNVETWDENAIEERGAELFQRALRLWPRP